MKFNQGQVLLAILVSNDGLPLGYELYPGSTYEGSTLAESVEKIKNKYKVGKVSFVADSGLFNAANIKFMEENGYDYIVGARIKNMSKSIQQEILDIESYSVKCKEKCTTFSSQKCTTNFKNFMPLFPPYYSFSYFLFCNWDH